MNSVEQLSTLTLALRATIPSSVPARPSSLGPFLQGALMERVNSDYAASLHQLPFNPYSQHCFQEGDILIWKVSALNNDAAAQIIEPLRSLDTIDLRSTGAQLKVLNTNLSTLKIDTLLSSLTQPGPSKVRIQFTTPTAFKSRGSYVIMPSARLIVQSLLMHYGQVYDNNKEGYEETVEYIDQHTRIVAYNLRSCSFDNVSHKRIPAFVGSLTLSLRGSDMACGLVRMLLQFGEFAGVGIKTSMGMGGCKCLLV